MMKKCTVHSVQCTGLAVFLFFLQIVCYAKNPDPYTWDFGRVRQGEILRHDFLLKNESNKVLNIKSVDTSCGCTVSKTKKSALLPQEATLIEVNFDSKGYLGPVQQVVYVNTDRLDTPVIRYIIKAEVVKSKVKSQK